jgi:curved DNA-binding protein CbpA
LENVDFTFLFSSAYDILSEEDKRKNYDMYLEAYLVLSDEDKRKNFDMYLDEKAQFGGTTRSQSGIRTINSQVFQKEIADQGITWLLLSYTPTLKGYQHIESIIEEVGSIMRGALRVLQCFHFLFLFLLSFDFPLIIVYAYFVFPLTGWKHKL